MKRSCERLLTRLCAVILCIWATTFSGLAGADGRDDLTQYLRPGHPDVYVVVKGDTLWDISGTFLTKPWLWPEIWQINPQIENPHLIYPGDEIALVFIDGRPRLQMQRGAAGRTYRMTPADSEKLQPQIRATPLATSVPALNLNAIGSFLVQNRVVAPEILEAAPYVLAGESQRIVLGAGDRVYVRGLLDEMAAYSIVRRGPLYIDPVTAEILGQEATYIGLGQALSNDNEVATLGVSSTREEVQVGDRILPTEERQLAANFFPSAPETVVDGQILSVFGGVTQVGQYDVVVLNRGSREGLAPGHVLAVYQRGAIVRDRVANQRVQLPSERAGLLMVFRAFEKLAYGLILSSDRALAVGDEIRNP